MISQDAESFIWDWSPSQIAEEFWGDLAPVTSLGLDLHSPVEYVLAGRPQEALPEDTRPISEITDEFLLELESHRFSSPIT